MAVDCESSSSAMIPVVTVPAPPPAPSSGTNPDDAFEEDACSICLEPFSSDDPATVTTCKHEYHLQCILEWSQRSKECPICWQSLVLKDPANQELLQAVEIERNSRSRQRSSNAIRFAHFPAEGFDIDHVVAPYEDDSDIDENIMRQLAAAALGRAHHLSRRQRHRALGLDPSQFHIFDASSYGSSARRTHETVPMESPILDNSTSESTSPSAAMPPERSNHLPSLVHPSLANIGSDTNRNSVVADQTPPRSPRRSRPSELFSFSESFKSKLTAASAKYKESISKGTRGFKEKLLARNTSVKELSKEVQREVTAGIASVARIMERLDPTSKRNGSSSSISNSAEGTSCISHDGKDLQGSLLVQFPTRIPEDASHGAHLNSPIHVSGTLSSLPNRVEVTRLQDILSRREEDS